MAKTSPITRVFLIRHGATVLTAEDRFAGATDVQLSDEGREQAARLAVRLSREAITAVHARLTLFNDTSHYTEAGLAIPAMPGARLSKWWAGGDNR
jgi:broad specificity phosphatase PhoE